MPHVQLEGTCDLQRFWRSFEPSTFRDGERILKAIQVYLEKDGRGLVVECMVIEGYLRQSFLAQAVIKEDGVLVKIFHVSHPERTPGVRACLAWLARRLLDQNPGASWAADNLGLQKPPADAG